MAAALSLDDIDEQILDLLERDGRRPLADLATEVNLSTSAVKRRVDRLERTGVIVGFSAIIDYCRDEVRPCFVSARRGRRHPAGRILGVGSPAAFDARPARLDIVFGGAGPGSNLRRDRHGQVRREGALITGGARGQGRSHAIAFAREGASIVVCDIAEQIDTVPYTMADDDQLAETAKLVEEHGQRCLALKADVRDTAAVARVVDETMSEFGRIDILIANHGVISLATVADMTERGKSDEEACSRRCGP